MDPNKLTQKSMEAIQLAETKALRYGQLEIEVEHLFLAMLEQEGGLLSRILTAMSVEVRALETEVEGLLSRMPKVSGPGRQPGKIYISKAVDRVLVKSEDEAKRMKDEYVSVEHIFLSILDEVKNSSLGKVFKLYNNIS